VDCKTCTGLITPLMDGELGDEERRATEQHLRSCPACARRRERLDQARSAFASARPAATGPGVDPRLLARVRTRRSRRRWMVPAAVAAALAVVGLLSLERGPEPPRPEEERLRMGRDVTLPPGMDAGRPALTTAGDCGAPGRTTCRVLVSPCASADTCGPAG
jgi:predicted anti-sigma-YlaC factor YlaD